MDCKFGEKVSLLMDGELPSAEEPQVKAHLGECADCRQLESDFLYFRRQIKDSAPVIGERNSVEPVTGKGWWGKRILLPAPALVLLVLAFGAFAIWSITANINREKSSVVAGEEDSGGKTRIQRPPLRNAPGEDSLSRFDHGGRAEIYTVKRRELSGGQKTESFEQ